MPEFKNYRFKDWEIKRQMRMIGTSENGEIITRFTNSVHTLLPDKRKN